MPTQYSRPSGSHLSFSHMQHRLQSRRAPAGFTATAPHYASDDPLLLAATMYVAQVRIPRDTELDQQNCLGH